MLHVGVSIYKLYIIYSYQYNMSKLESEEKKEKIGN